ncbi:MAG: hypothetical protein AB7T74_03940 [Clostridia bacterium]|jgi:hypothetical protein
MGNVSRTSRWRQASIKQNDHETLAMDKAKLMLAHFLIYAKIAIGYMIYPDAIKPVVYDSKHIFSAELS